MMMRLRLGHEEKEIWDRLFPQLLAADGCCDEVWFSTGVGFPFLEEHRRRSCLMAEHAKELRRAGITPSLQIQTTLGHSDSCIEFAGAEGKTWGSYVGVNGEQCRYVNCPRQKGFLEYYYQLARIYAQWHPGSVWIDDDLRLYNHGPAMDPCGCYCPDCLALFAQEEGKLYTREELVCAYQKDEELFKRWEKFSIASLEQVAQVIVKGFKEISPETRFGLQHCCHPMRMQVLKSLQKFSGARVGSRPGGGAYCDHYNYNLIGKALLISMQLSEQPGYSLFDQICPEIESCPRTFGCKTPQGHRIESLLYLAMGTDSLSYFIMDPYLETPEWYGKNLLQPLAAEAECYREFIRHNKGVLPGGIGIVSTFEARSHFYFTGLPLVGVPFGGCSPRSCARMLEAETAEKLSREELEKLFQGNVLLDGHAAMALQKRNFNDLLEGSRVAEVDVPVFEFFTDDPLNGCLGNDRHRSFNCTPFAFQVPETVKKRTLGIYRDRLGKAQGEGTCLIETAKGTRIGLLGFEGFSNHYISSSRVQMLYQVMDWAGKGELPVLPTEPVQMLLVPGVTSDGTLRSVTCLNPTIGTQRPFEVILRHVPENVTEGEFLIPASPAVKVPLRFENGVCKALLPELPAWGIGWLKIPEA